MSAQPIPGARGDTVPYRLRPRQRQRFTGGFYHITASTGEFVVINAKLLPCKHLIQPQGNVYQSIDFYVENNGDEDCCIHVTEVEMTFPKNCGMPPEQALVA
jgi:hypothetical protein